MNYPALSKSVQYLIERDVDIDPRVLAVCPDLAQSFAKTYDYFLRNMQRLIRSVYEGNLGGDFVEIASNLIAGQLRQAYEQAWKDEGTGGEIPDYLTEAADAMTADQQSFVDGLYRDVVDARVDEKPLDSVLYRAEMWANQWNTAYGEGVRLITLENGGKMIWKYSPEKEHCGTCSALNGIVAYASEWESLGVHPADGPNELLECNGFQCGCTLSPTDKRRSPRAFETIQNIVTR